MNLEVKVEKRGGFKHSILLLLIHLNKKTIRTRAKSGGLLEQLQSRL